MKLLRKSEVLALKESERAREAAEGVKIARRVDELRELQTNTAKKLDDFRDSTLRVITEEIKSLGAKRDSLANEVSVLQKKYDALLPGIPLKREAIKKREEAIATQEQVILAKEESLRLQELDIYELKEAVKKNLAQAASTNESADNRLKDAFYKEGEASQALQRAQKVESNAVKAKEVQEMQLGERERAVARREGDFEIRVSIQEAKEREFEQERKKLEDRRAMVERTLERLKQNRIDVR